MEFEIQQSSEFDGFIDENESMSFMHDDNFESFDDEMYNNLLGLGGKKAKRIDAQTDQIKSQTQALKDATDKKMQEIAQQDKATQDSIRQAKELREQLEKLSELPPQSLVASPTNEPPMTAPQQGMSNTMKYGLIGGGVLLVGIVVAMMIRK